MRLNGCHALITGASSGIGREFARQLAARAGLLVLVARRLDLLEELRAELAGAHPQLRLEIRRTDLTNDNEIEALLAWLQSENLAPDFLINNAGLGDLGAFATADPEKLDRMMLVNIVGLTRLTRGLLPAMIAQNRGAIVNVSSSAGFLPLVNFAVYAATKAYVTSFSEALRSEVRAHGVDVTALCPGPVRTGFTEVAQRNKSDAELGPALVYVSVENVVAAALRGVQARRAIVIPGLAMKIGMALVRLTPMPVLRLASRFNAKSA
ncbi:MAG: SDR family oxidoreductase [Chthoniobacterales bacterium]|nr:SDR family oxidoreductase [Chthoniobacterales bacterium]